MSLLEKSSQDLVDTFFSLECSHSTGQLSDYSGSSERSCILVSLPELPTSSAFAGLPTRWHTVCCLGRFWEEMGRCLSSVHLSPLLSGADSLEMLSLVLGFSDSTPGQHRVETVALCRGLKRLLEEKYCSVPATSVYQSDELHPVYCIVLCIYTQYRAISHFSIYYRTQSIIQPIRLHRYSLNSTSN